MHRSDFNYDVFMPYMQDLLTMIAVSLSLSFSHVTDQIIAIPNFPTHVGFIELLSTTMMPRRSSYLPVIFVWWFCRNTTDEVKI